MALSAIALSAVPARAADCANELPSGGGRSFSEAVLAAVRRTPFATETSSTIGQRAVLDQAAALAQPASAMVSPSGRLLVIADGRTGLHAVDLRPNSDCRLVQLRPALSPQAFNARAAEHWSLRQYMMKGWDPAFTPSHALLMGVEMLSDGMLRDTAPMRGQLLAGDLPGSDCLVYLLRNQRKVDVASVCLTNRLEVHALASEQLGHVALSTAGSFVALQGKEQLRIVSVDGREASHVPHDGYRNEIFWLDDRSLLVYSNRTSAVYDVFGRSGPLLNCEGRPAELPALLNRLPDGDAEIVDDRGAVLTWNANEHRLSCE